MIADRADSTTNSCPQLINADGIATAHFPRAKPPQTQGVLAFGSRAPFQGEFPSSSAVNNFESAMNNWGENRSTHPAPNVGTAYLRT